MIDSDAPEGSLRALAEGLEDGVLIVDGGRIGWASPRAGALAGSADPASLVGCATDSVFEDSGSGLPGLGRAGAVRCRLRGRNGSREVHVTRLVEESAAGENGDAPGEEVWLVRNAERKLEAELYAVGVELHDANRELARLREQIESEIAAREELLTVVSHELRTPVTVIRGYNNLLLSDQTAALDEQQYRFLEESNRSCEKLNRFIGDLLDACGDASASSPPAFEIGSVDTLISGVVSFLRPLLDERRLHVECKLDPDARHAHFDPGRIEQVLTNLLSNAIRYSEVGTGIEIRTAPLAAAGHSFVEIAVIDTGPGIAPADRERIFEPYVRSGDDRTGAGLGLGLAICRRIVDAHGGAIDVLDEPGRGCRFTFTLPAVLPGEEGSS